jgi:hypothetical protein
VHPISPFVFRVCLLTGTSEINFDPENWTRHYIIFDLADQPLYFRSKGPVSFAFFFLPNPHHLPAYRIVA